MLLAIAADSMQNKILEELDAIHKNGDIKKEPAKDSEAEIEAAFGKRLEEQGIAVQHQVVCVHGRADLVTPDAIYEIKDYLTRNKLQQAIGQVLAYRTCLNPEAKVYVVGRQWKDKPVAIDLAQAVGVGVIVWGDENVSLA